MAPNKKTKKLASNPARGFATTSTVSKAKLNHVVENNEESKAEDSGRFTKPEQEPASIPSHESGNNVEKALHELSPEELEKQLEESTLQVFVETYGNKVKKEASRHLFKMQTERRLLRAQAEPLSTHQWLPPEIVQLIINLLDSSNTKQSRSDESDSALDPKQGVANFSDDDLLIKLWTLRQLLPQLSFSLSVTLLALRHLLGKLNYLDPKSLSPAKDSVWGLGECLSWLALEVKPEELPRLEPQDAQKLPGRGRKLKGATSVAEAGKIRPLGCRSRKGAMVNEEVKGLTLAGSETESTAPGDSRPTTPPRVDSPLQTDHSPDEGTPPSSQSETESDLEPDELVERYLGAQRRLYEINPESFDLGRKMQRNGKNRAAAVNGNVDPNANPLIARLTAKLKKIKSDILFDEDEAKRRWAEIQIDLATDASDRRRLGIRNINDIEQSTNRIDLAPDASNSGTPDNGEDTAGMLGELFSTLPDSTTDPTTGLSCMTTSESGGSTVKIRDFGRSTGMSPRRVFEEACRSRDSSVRVSYKLTSSSTFSKRHSLEVYWSREQVSAPNILIEDLAYKMESGSVKVEMTTIACPDAAQSESFVSTCALFLIFASSPEEKVYLRLPSVWRHFWDELAILQREHDDEKDRDVLRELRSMVDEVKESNCHIASNSTNPGVDGVWKEPTPGMAVLEGSNQLPVAPPDEMTAIWMAKASMPSYQHMLPGRMNLPIFKFKDDLLLAIEDHQVVIICGETGCGKSTQVPAYILERELSSGRYCKIYCTEPRRISAISLARRVSEELGERKGDVGTFRSLVGFAIRLESQITAQTRLVYATTGIVMRMLEGSNELRGITHLVLDEVHERSIDSDFLLIVLRKVLIRRPDLKVILMSATVDAQRFSDYLDQAPVLNVPGRTFPVKTRYLEDAIEETHFGPAASTSGKYEDEEGDVECSIASAKTSLSANNLRNYSPDTCNALLKFDEYRVNYDLILKLLMTIATVEHYSFYSKAILVFLPGIAEIRRLNDMLAGHQIFRNGWHVHALHSTIATDEQEQAFLVPPPGIRKIVLATNIAETGITIPDVTCVIDTGKHKEMRFDERRQLSRLIEVFISRANAKQRRGRAGRVQKGLCFHLYTKDRQDNILPEEQTPEMLRLSLQDLVLRVKICKLGGIEQTLSEALDPPSSKNIRRAIDSLIDVKALTNTEDLTALGRQLARLPLDVFLGKLILLGSTFGCLDAMLTIAAILSSKSPFSAPMGARSQMDIVRLAFRKGDSDLLTVYNAYCAWRRICSTNAMPEHHFCRKNFLNSQILSNIEDLKAQLTTSLADAGFMMLGDAEKASLNRVRYYSRKRSFVDVPSRYNTNNDNDLILNSVIAWSFYPKLLYREGKGWKNIANNQAVSLHPTSVNKGMSRPPQWLSFYYIMQSSNKFYNAHETSPVEDFAVALVCGEAEFKMYSGVIVIDGNRIRFSLDDWRTILVIKALRTQIRQVMAQSFRSPGRLVSPQQQEWLSIWEKIFTLNGKPKV